LLAAKITFMVQLLAIALIEKHYFNKVIDNSTNKQAFNLFTLTHSLPQNIGSSLKKRAYVSSHARY
jgi:hypothetical protein